MYLSLSEEPEVIYSNALALSNIIPNCFSYMHNVDKVKDRTFVSLKEVWSINPKNDKLLLEDLINSSDRLLTVAKELRLFFDHEQKFADQMKDALTNTAAALESSINAVDKPFILVWNAYYITHRNLGYDPRLATLSKSFLSSRTPEDLQRLVAFYENIYSRLEKASAEEATINSLKDRVLDLEVSLI